eukprot:4596443-Amphidinium_carterae.1
MRQKSFIKHVHTAKETCPCKNNDNQNVRPSLQQRRRKDHCWVDAAFHWECAGCSPLNSLEHQQVGSLKRKSRKSGPKLLL